MTDVIAKPVEAIDSPKDLKVEAETPEVKAPEVKEVSKEDTTETKAIEEQKPTPESPKESPSKKSKKKKKAAKAPEPEVSLAVETPKEEAPKASPAEVEKKEAAPNTEEPAVAAPEPVSKDSPKVEEPVVESSDPVKKEDEPVPASSPTKPSPVKIDEDGTITIGSTEKATTQEEKVPESKEEATKEETAPEPEVKSGVEVAEKLEKEIEKVIEQVSVPDEPVQKPDALSVAHQESLTQIHQKLDSLIASDATAKAAVVEPTPDVVTPDLVEKIHLKIDALVLSHSESAKLAALQAEKAIEKITQIDLADLHAKLDKMQETLAIKPKSDEGFVHVHQKMDTIHEAILASAKPAPVEVAPEPVTEKIDVASAAKLEELHQKFETMQAAIDKLTEALAQKLAAESTPAPSVAPVIEAKETSKDVVPEITEPVAKDPPAAETAKADDAITPQSSKVSEDSKLVKEASADSKKTSSSDGSTPKKHAKRSSFFGGFFGSS